MYVGTSRCGNQLTCTKKRRNSLVSRVASFLYLRRNTSRYVLLFAMALNFFYKIFINILTEKNIFVFVKPQRTILIILISKSNSLKL